ncbi:MAG: hypothetical protein QM756_19620 [Polyangiaceae bacterium]
MSDAKRAQQPSKALISGVFVALCLIGFAFLAGWFAHVFAPDRRASAPPPARAFDSTAARGFLTTDAVQAEQRAILELGSRYLGQPGVEAAREHVRKRFTELGLELFEQRAHTVVPRTARREILSEPSGQPLDGVDVYPFMPNHLQPVVTRAEGLTGELLLLDPKTLATRRDFHDVIGVLDAAPGGVDPSYGYQWARYAGLGVKALIVAHRDGLGAVDFTSVAKFAREQSSGLVSSVPVNFVRLAATPAIFTHLGERVRLKNPRRLRRARKHDLVRCLARQAARRRGALGLLALRRAVGAARSSAGRLAGAEPGLRAEPGQGAVEHAGHADARCRVHGQRLERDGRRRPERALARAVVQQLRRPFEPPARCVRHLRSRSEEGERGRVDGARCSTSAARRAQP